MNIEGDTQSTIISEIEILKNFCCAEDFYSYFEQNHYGIYDALDSLIKINTTLSIYVLIQILGNPSIYTRLNWKEVSTFETQHIRAIGTYGGDLIKYLYPHLIELLKTGNLKISKCINASVKDLSYEDFKNGFERYLQGRRSSRMNINKRPIKNKQGLGNLYNKYEHGYSDW